MRLRACPEPRSQRPGLKLGRQTKQTRLSGIQVLVTRGAVSSGVERSDSMFGSWRKLPDGAQPTPPEQCLMAQASSDNFPECGCKVRGRRKTWTEIMLFHASTRLINFNFIIKLFTLKWVCCGSRFCSSWCVGALVGRLLHVHLSGMLVVCSSSQHPQQTQHAK